MSDDWISADEAMSRLRIKPQTLYSYVSRGLIEAVADDADPRRSRYRASDVAELETRKARGRDRAAIAVEAINWGEPVLSSELTTISHGRLFYRGKDVETLARTASFEDVARLLWACGEARFPPSPAPGATGSARERMFAVLARRAARDAGLAGRTAEALYLEAAAVVDELADAASLGAGSGPIHQRFARGWGLDAAGGESIRMALVVLADHELDASTFAARVAASTGASLAACALAGLAALSGPRHGGMSPRVRAFAENAERLGPREAVLAHLSASGAAPPGFGHPFYPDGDPRARLLIGAGATLPLYQRLAETAYEISGYRPNADFALASMRESLGLPEDAPFLIFAVSRSVGWIAHALEQSRTRRIIRPRARYVGPQLEAEL